MHEAFDHKTFLKSLTTQPGIYQMFDIKNHSLYVGKAKNLKNRVSSYFQKTNNLRIASLVSQIHHIEIIVTKSENEALLLEINLIKELKPRYNILFRDDKSYPYIFISANDQYPRLDFHRGAKTANDYYFGPYPSSGAVRQSLHLLQKIFKIRQCSNNFFNNRTRPCIQYQIKRCTAPCVGLITPEKYQISVRLAKLFLEGKNKEIIIELMQKMELASQQLEYEEAAKLRDQIKSLRQIQEQQHVIAGQGDIDIIAAIIEADTICIEVLFIRAGRMIGNHHFFNKLLLASQATEIVLDFIPQFYLNAKHKRDIPRYVLTNTRLTDIGALEEVLMQMRGSKVIISTPSKGNRLHWVQMAEKNAKMALASYLAGKQSFLQRLQVLQHALKLDNLPQRIECFDISHSLGEATVASCVVFNEEGAVKSAYRRFNIEGITKGDDYAALKQALLRRYTRLKEEAKELPDLILIDGGKGQLKQARDVLEELQISGVNLFSIAKGAGRKPGLETIYKYDTEAIHLDEDNPGLHVLQQIRDEAHRFAITGHKKQREQIRKTSTLESIPGIGIKRRKQLLNYFGGLQGVISASLSQLAEVPGISPELAQKIYAYFHE